MGLATAPANLDEYIIKNHLTDDFEDFIHRVSGQDFEFQKPNDDDKELYCIFGLGRIPFDKIASTGTHSLMLLYYWLKQMKTAAKLAEADRGQAAPKKSAPDRGDR